MSEKLQSIDIIIPTYKPGEKFLRLFAMLKAQSFPYRHLILINTEAKWMPEEIREKVNADERTILRDITAEEFDHAATRAAGVRLSDADCFVCMTDDAVPADTELLEKLMKALSEDEKTAIAYARQLAAEDADESEKYVRIFNYPDQSRKKSIADLPKLGIKTFFASNVCCAYKRRIYEELGGFTDTAIFNEDMIFASTALKAGYSSMYAADAKVVHSHNYTASQQFHRNFDLGVSQSMHPEVFAGLKSEGEGIRLVKNTIAHLAKSGHIQDIPVFVIRTAFRYAGYKAGKAYDRLSDSQVRFCAMNKKGAERIISDRKGSKT